MMKRIHIHKEEPDTLNTLWEYLWVLRRINFKTGRTDF